MDEYSYNFSNLNILNLQTSFSFTYYLFFFFGHEISCTIFCFFNFYCLSFLIISAFSLVVFKQYEDVSNWLDEHFFVSRFLEELHLFQFSIFAMIFYYILLKLIFVTHVQCQQRNILLLI